MLSNTDVMPFARRETAKGQREQKKDRDLLYTAEEKSAGMRLFGRKCRGACAASVFFFSFLPTW